MTNTVRERDIFNALKKQFGVTPTPAYLRKQIAIKNNQAAYRFTFDDNADKGADKNLKRQDYFVVTSWGLFVTREAIAKPGSGILQTYINNTFFPPVAGPPAFVPADLETIYNGYIDTLTDKDKIYEGYQADRFLVVPQTQQSPTIAKSQRNSDDGYVDIDPLIHINGDRKNEFTLYLPTYAGIAFESQTAGVDNLVVLIPRGFLLSNVTKDM